MDLQPRIQIEPVGESACDEFFRYLNDHRSDNGKEGTGYFIPISQSDWRFPREKEAAYREGLELPLGCPGWRRAWVARVASRKIVGHIDLWSHPMRFAEHRCLLGMGVDRDHRRLGVGTALMAYAIHWALRHTALEWFDLHVLSTNENAIRLYLRAGFTQVGEVPEMFKFDGRVFSDITMARRLREAR